MLEPFLRRRRSNPWLDSRRQNSRILSVSLLDSFVWLSSRPLCHFSRVPRQRFVNKPLSGRRRTFGGSARRAFAVQSHGAFKEARLLEASRGEITKVISSRGAIRWSQFFKWAHPLYRDLISRKEMEDYTHVMTNDIKKSFALHSFHVCIFWILFLVKSFK